MYVNSNHYVFGPVAIVWNADDSIHSITYEGKLLIKAVHDRAQHIRIGSINTTLPTGLNSLITDLLNSIAKLPSNEKRRKIFLADKLFEHLQIDTKPSNPKIRSLIWREILNLVWQWEDSHEEVHKGTAYYFMAATYLSLGDVPSAYICFFKALEEDKRNFPRIPKNLKDAPTYRTTSLVDNPHNALYPAVVIPLRHHLQTFIDRYNKIRRGKNLTLQILDQKFLQVDAIEDIKRFFVAIFHEIYHLAPLNSSRMINNDYSKLKVIDSIFNMSLIVDQLLEHRLLANAPRKNMANAVYRLALHLNWTTPAKHSGVREFLRAIQPNLNVNSPDTVVPSLLNGQATFDGRKLIPDMQAVFLAYHLRNFAGHNIKGQDVLIQRYAEVLNYVMDALFIAVEVL